MSSKFYAHVIAENRQEIDNTELKKASRDLFTYYSRSSKEALTPPDYNNPAYCCAYLYKYSSLHTGMVIKYFRKMFRKKEVKNILNFNRNIKICCLGGGPGIEIVGIFRALTISPHFHYKVAKVSVLDECVGWEASFDSIMSNLIDGKVKQVPPTRKFAREFIQVDLQGPLPDKVRKVISNADVIFMMKFVSELSIDTSSSVLKGLGELFKSKALILYIDNFKRDTFESVDCFSRSPDFKVVLGPLEDEKFVSYSSSDVVTYGCKPHTHARISVIGWMKTPKESIDVYDASLSAKESIDVYDASLSAKESIDEYNVSLSAEESECDISLSAKESINEYDASLSAKESINEYDASLSAKESINEYDASLSAKESINEYDASLSAEESINEYDASLSAKESINEYDASLSAKESINEYDASLSAKESINEYDASLSAKESINEYDASLSAKESINEYDVSLSAEESECDISLSDEESIDEYDVSLSAKESINEYDVSLSAKESINVSDASLSAEESIDVSDDLLSASHLSLTHLTIGTESEIKDSDILRNSDEEWEDISCDKYTQTEQDYFNNSFENGMFPSTVEVELAELKEALSDLITLMERFTSNKKMQRKEFCCHHACY